MVTRRKHAGSYYFRYTYAGMMGDEFLLYMKHNELFKSIPIIMLSSEESTTERIRLLEEGAADYILKPFNPLELKVRIKKIID